MAGFRHTVLTVSDGALAYSTGRAGFVPQKGRPIPFSRGLTSRAGGRYGGAAALQQRIFSFAGSWARQIALRSARIRVRGNGSETERLAAASR